MRRLLPLFLALLVVASCSKTDDDGKKTDPGKGFPGPRDAAMTEPAPATFKARFTTSAGVFVIEVTREWAPIGADRFYSLVRHGWYDDTRVFRVEPGFVVQFGLSGDPQRTKAWERSQIPDDPVMQSNSPGTVTFAKAPALNSRTTQIFINLGDNKRLDVKRFAPFGTVVDGMDVVKTFKPGVGRAGQKPDQGKIMESGNEYLDIAFPQLVKIEKAEIVK